jgi:hypothetical protein
VQLGTTAQKLKALGIQALGIMATNAERARLFFRFRPPRVPVGADPELITHRAYGLPQSQFTPELAQELEPVIAVRARELNLDLPRPLNEAFAAMDRLDGFEPAPSDDAEFQRHQVQRVGQFLVDKDGIVRWAYVECAQEGIAGADKFPTDEELLAAARAL